MKFLIVGGKEFQIVGDASLKARVDMLFVADCCLRSGAVYEQCILVFGFCWMRLLKWAV